MALSKSRLARAMRLGGSRNARAWRRGQTGTPGPRAMTIRAWRTHGARSNNPGTPIEPESPRKGSSRGRLARLHQRCVGCDPEARPGGSDRQFALNGGSGNRRRGTRRRGAAAASERTAMRSALREAVPGEVQAGSAGAPARVSRAMRAAVPDRGPGLARRERRGGRGTHAQHGAAARDAAAPDRGPGQAPQRRAASDSETPDRSPGQAPHERGAKRARGRRCRATDVRTRNGPRRHRPLPGMTTRPAMRCGQAATRLMPRRV